MKRHDPQELMPLDGSMFGDLPQAAVDGREQQAAAHMLDATVMMVDDDPMMTDVIQTYLEDAGYQHFVSINDPLQALDAARSHLPSLILLDLMMPGMSGFEVLEQLRNDEALRYIPVIVLTAASNPATKLKALELGATEFLAKPVDSSELVLRVRNSLVFKVYQDRLANEDPLTGLTNRRVFVERLQRALKRAHEGQAAEGRAAPQMLAMMQIGLDRFRQVNETLGHGAGDRLLAAVARRLHACSRREEATGELRTMLPMLSRLGGDEFALLVPRIASPAAADRVARRLLGAMALPFELDGKELFVTASIGISVFPEDGDTHEQLMAAAGSACTHAKDSGRNNSQFYSAALNNVSLERLALETDLHRAIGRDQLLLHYQPKVDLRSGRVTGAEALLRWQHPVHGLVPPDRFIPLAEEIGLIVEMGEWVAYRACSQLAEWRNRGLGQLKLAINVSRHELAAGGLVNTLSTAMACHGVQPGQLTVELTESMLMDRMEDTQRQLKALREMGVELSIDDFGTGYSSFNYLKRFPVHELKIDRSFITGMPEDTTDSAIVGAIVALGHSLRMHVVAEGVETEGQRAVLQALGCDTYQGYLCSKPLPPDAFAARVGEINLA